MGAEPGGKVLPNGRHMTTGDLGVYGFPPPALADVDPLARQFSPLVPGADDLTDLAEGSLERVVIAAPPGTLERRFVLAQALRALRPGGELLVMAPKDKGGARLRDELEAFGCAVVETAKRHHRLCLCRAPVHPRGLADAMEAGGPRRVAEIGLWSQPGVFSWDRVDPGSALLQGRLADLAGRGADLGCGIGVLARAALGSKAVSDILLIDIDRRAVAAAARNIDDRRARLLHADARQASAGPEPLDFVIMNPPFHEGGVSEPALGQALIGAAAGMLKSGGVCRLVANLALPYEATLAANFGKVSRLHEAHGYKLIEARR